MIIFCLFQIINAMQYYQNDLGESTTSLKVGESKSIMELSKALNGQLILQEGQDNCHLKPNHLETDLQEYQIVEQNEFSDFDFESDTPLNFRQLLSMAHIRDGIILLTSDLMLYFFKFNYDIIFPGRGLPNFGTGSFFGSYPWKTDLQKYVPYTDAKSEFPDLIYSNKTSIIMIIYQKAAQWINVTEFEENSDTAYLRDIGRFVIRNQRTLSKEYDGFIFSCVGADGIDIYLVVTDDVLFLQTIFQIGDTYNFDVIDIQIQSKMENIYNLIMLTQDGIVVLGQLRYNNLKFEIEEVNQFNFNLGEGIAISMSNVIVTASKKQLKYLVTQLIYDSQLNQITLKNQIVYNSAIFDVEIVGDIVMVQGYNYHSIIFLDANTDIKPRFKIPPYTNIGLRDFSFQKYSSITDKLEDYQNFLFGITAYSVFLSRYELQSTRISCYGGNVGYSKYQLIYNQTDSSQDAIMTNYKTIHLHVEQLINQQLLFLIICSVIVFLVIVCLIIFLFYRRYRNIQIALEQQMKRMEKIKDNNEEGRQQIKIITNQMESRIELGKGMNNNNNNNDILYN